MKRYKLSLLALGTAMLCMTACNDINDMLPEGGSPTQGQMDEASEKVPSRKDASFNGIFSMMGEPYFTYGSTRGRADDFGFIMSAISLDIEGADMLIPNSGYNWFSVCGEYSSRNANYANPYTRYNIAYSQISIANNLIQTIPAETTDSVYRIQRAQACAVRAFDYMALAPYFQGRYVDNADQLCVPIVTLDVDATHNPRATVKEVYDYILADLNYAVEKLEGFVRPSKAHLDQSVALGLRARAYLNMGMYAEAAADAQKAIDLAEAPKPAKNPVQAIKPASISDVSKPAFCDMSKEDNWMWGINITDDMVQGAGYPTSSSWVSPFSGDGYAAACACSPQINVLLYDKIPSTDVRKGWWLDKKKHSANWASLSWQEAVGDAIADLKINDVKVPFEPYTNIKFGMKSGIGSTLNNNDWPLMRIEEMYLVLAEGLAKSGQDAKGRTVLENFVKTYRDPNYSSTRANRSLDDEIWYQRRIELWGEGFFVSDARRLGKPIVRFHELDASGAPTGTNQPAAFAFNIAADDGWLNMRFPQAEMDTNLSLVDNSGGSLPQPGQNPTLRDGVTD